MKNSSHMSHVNLYTFVLSFPFKRDSPSKKPDPPLYFTKPFQVCFQVQLSFEEKSAVTGVFFQKLCAHFVCGERKERKKGKVIAGFPCEIGLKTKSNFASTI